jgi:hypothetical protein
MSKVKDQLAQVGMGTLVAGMKAVENSISRKQYKRLIATAVAQLLTLHPDYGAGKARRRARQVAGAKPARKLLVKPSKVGAKKGLEAVAAAAATGVAAKIAGKAGRKITERVTEAVGAGATSGAGNGRGDDQENRN